MRLPCCVLGLGLVAGLTTACNRTENTKAEGTTWVVSEQPILVIADSANPPGHEFNGISSARRRHDRSILLANAGAVELALYDSAGRFQRAVGRKGQGPGEFQGPISVFAWRADSLVVYDPAVLRWTFLDTGLIATRTVQVPSPDLLQPTWLYKGAMVIDGVTDPVPTWILAVLDSVRQKDPGYHRLVRAWHDDVGALWVRDSIDDRRWAVYTEAGPTTANVILPPQVEPLEIGEDFVLGVVKDSLGVEEIRVHSLLRSKVNTGTPDLTPTRVPSERAMLQPFRDLLMAQEVYFSSHGRYASALDSLKVSTPFPGRLFLLAGDQRHWAGVSVRPETGVTCGVSVGSPAPLGWLDGYPFCGR
jgi:hypothetical protein